MGHSRPINYSEFLKSIVKLTPYVTYVLFKIFLGIFSIKINTLSNLAGFINK